MYNNTLEFPLNLADDIYKVPVKIDKEKFEKNLNYITEKIFTKKEQRIIYGKYRDGIELIDFAKEFNVSYEWVRRSLIRTLKKLSRPHIAIYLRTGELPDRLPIEFLKIDLRYYNGLKWNDLDYIDDIVALDRDTFANMPKIGKKGAEEIIKAIDNLNFDTEGLKYSNKILNSIYHLMKMYNINK